MSAKRDAIPWEAIARRFSIGPIEGIATGGGTALAKVVLDTPGGRYILRQRRPAWSSRPVCAFDHGVIRCVAEAGLPTPLPVPSRNGQTWVMHQGLAYEFYPFVEGLGPFQADSRAQLESAALSLCLFHQATAQAHIPGEKEWPREHRIDTMVTTLAGVLAQLPDSSAQLELAERMLASARKLALYLATDRVRALPHVVIHGDYTPANVLFRGEQVGGIFDFDWASRQPRLVDIGEAIAFFAFPRATPIDPDSIWSLVQAWRPHMEGLRLFLAAYQSAWPLTDQEAAVLPLLMRETWLGVRIRAMRKVSPERQLEILTDGALGPLQWLESHARAITEAALQTRPRA